MTPEKAEAYLKLAAVAVAFFVLYKIWQIGSKGIATVVDTVKEAADVASNVFTGEKAKELEQVLRAALIAKGQNPDNLLIIFPPPKSGQKLPKGSWVVTYQGKNYYFAPKGASPVFSL